MGINRPVYAATAAWRGFFVGRRMSELHPVYTITHMDMEEEKVEETREETARLLDRCAVLNRQKEELTADLRIQSAELEEQLLAVRAEIRAVTKDFDTELRKHVKRINQLNPWANVTVLLGGW